MHSLCTSLDKLCKPHSDLTYIHVLGTAISMQVFANSNEVDLIIACHLTKLSLVELVKFQMQIDPPHMITYDHNISMILDLNSKMLSLIIAPLFSH